MDAPTRSPDYDLFKLIVAIVLALILAIILIWASPSQTPVSLLITPSVAFLASPAAAHITGQAFNAWPNFVSLDPHDGPGYQITFIERGDGAVDEGVHLLIGVLGLLNDLVVVDHFCGPLPNHGAPCAMYKPLQVSESSLTLPSRPSKEPSIHVAGGLQVVTRAKREVG